MPSGFCQQVRTTKKQCFSAELPLYRSSRNYMQPISVAQVAVVRPHRLPALTSTVNRFGQDAADEGIGFEILFNPGLVQVESLDTDTGAR